MTQSNVIRSVQDAIDSVHMCGFEKGHIMFRGQINSQWEISPTLFRKYPVHKQSVFYETASIQHIFSNKLLPYVHSFDPFELLMTYQHFGQPTRLLDFTNDILVGLFFACYDPEQKEVNKDGRLTLVEKSIFKSIRINTLEQREYKKPLDPEKYKTYASRLIVDDIYLIEPLIKNSRMRVQEGCFMFFPWKIIQESSNLSTLNAYMKHRKTDKSILHKDVPKEYKTTILEELDKKYGISEETMFVDREYSKKSEGFFKLLEEENKKIYIEIINKSS